MATYGDPDAHAQMGGGPGPYGNQNGTPPAQQQQQHLTDPELRLQENLQQLRDGGDMIHTGGPQQPQYQQLQMGPAMGAHQHFQAPPRPAHSPQQMAHAVMSLEGHPDTYDPNDPSRKRSKVSRACDECRRKKIRCDATSENGPDACSSCKRTGARCQFSRQPMKRGPSKGYIKELADRLNSLESQIQHPQNTAQNFDFGSMGEQNFLDAQSPPQFKRQRTHSMTDGFHEAFGRSSWSGQDRGNTFSFGQEGYSMLTGQEPSMNSHHRNSFSDLNLAANLITSSNEGTLKAYYNIIHPTLPILPHQDAALNRLSNCPSKLREAFFLSLESAVRSLAPKSLPQTDFNLSSLLQQSSLAVEAANWSLDDSDDSRQFYNHVIFCQSLILLAIAGDRPASANVKSPSLLLGQINGVITLNRLNDSTVLNMLKQQDLELFQSARRVFWVARILDTFHACSRSKDTMLDHRASELLRDDLQALGEVGYHLARTAKILGVIHHARQLYNIPRNNPMSSSYPAWLDAAPLEYEHLHGRLLDLRESLNATDLTDNSPPYLTHQYLSILVARFSSQHAPSTHLLAITKELLGNLMNGAITPLHHVFAPLVATSLNDLSERVETQIEADASIKEMSSALANGQIVHRGTDGTGWDTTIQDLLHQKKGPSPPLHNPPEPTVTEPNMAGLQHLAAAAVGEREGADTRPASSGGNTAAQVAKVESDLSAAMAAANEAAKAQATAAAAQQLSSPGGNHDLFH